LDATDDPSPGDARKRLCESPHNPEAMTAVEFPERVQRADRWAWIGSTFVTIGLFSVGILLTGDVGFSAVVGAGAGIGTQFLIPYVASLSVPVEERLSLADHPTADAYHHGAAAGSLLLGSLVALAVGVVRADALTGLWVGGLLLVVSYVPLSRLLPER
jgi:hypothetical protein